jgi:S-layer protein
LNSVDAVTAVTASGAGVTTITAHAGDAAVTSYTSTGGGLKIAAAIGNGVSFTGSSGTDSVIVGATTKAIAMGAGDDSATVTAVLGTGGTVDGGTGSDTLVINVAAATFSDAAAQPRITGFEKLELGTAATGSYNGAGFTEGYSLTGALTGDSTITNAVANSTVTIGTTTGKTLDVVYADATGKADVANLVLSSKAALDLDTNADVTFAGVETINITSTDKDTTAHQNTLDLDAVNATTVVATGSAGLVMVNTDNVKITSFDASGISMAKVTDSGVTFTSANTTVGEAITIKGSNGVDSLTGHSSTNDTIDGGSGVDTIVYTGGTDTFTGGAGKDVFDVNGDSTSKTSFLTIADIADGDTIDLAGIAGGTLANMTAAQFKAAKVELGAGATFDQYLTAALDQDGSTNEVLEWFVYDSNTYLAISDDNTDGLDAVDSIIKLAGTHNIEDSTVTSEVITIA